MRTSPERWTLATLPSFDRPSIFAGSIDPLTTPSSFMTSPTAIPAERSSSATSPRRFRCSSLIDTSTSSGLSLAGANQTSIHIHGACTNPAPTSEAGNGSLRAVRSSSDHNSAAVALGWSWASRAATPATWGVAMLVPLIVL